jgi:molybdopterin-binding protein
MREYQKMSRAAGEKTESGTEYEKINCNESISSLFIFRRLGLAPGMGVAAIFKASSVLLAVG